MIEHIYKCAFVGCSYKYKYMSKWFAAKLVLNLDKTNIIKIYTNECTLSTVYTEKYIEDILNTKFLGLQIDPPKL
jgi:hypothetical protein